MYNKLSMFILVSLFFSITPAVSAAAESAAENAAGNTAAIAEPDRGNFEGDVSDAAADMLDAMNVMRRNKFFREVNRLIDKRDLKKAEEFLENRAKDVPEQKNDECYAMAKSKIAYAKGDYQSAYAAADGLMAAIEKYFAPHKPYEVEFKNKNQRDTLSSVYVLRFQALSRLGRHAEALADLNSAQRLGNSPEISLSKASTLLWLGRYREAAAETDKSYALNKETFASSPFRQSFCDNFRSQGLQTKACEGPVSAPGKPAGK